MTQAGQFGAAWSLGLVAALARGRLDAVALGSATGPRGVMGGNAQSVVPAYHILAGLAPHSGSRMIASLASAPAAIATLAHQTRSGPVIWVANLTGRPQKLTFTGLDSPVMQHVIDADSFVATGSADFLASAGQRLNRLRDLTLQPYAVTRLAQS